MTFWKNEIKKLEDNLSKLNYQDDMHGDNINKIEAELRELAKWIIGENEKEYGQLMRILNSADLSDLDVGSNKNVMEKDTWISVKDACVKVLNALELRTK